MLLDDDSVVLLSVVLITAVAPVIECRRPAVNYAFNASCLTIPALPVRVEDYDEVCRISPGRGVHNPVTVSLSP